MSRASLAFIAFFRILFGKKLPAEAVTFLPEEALPKALPPAEKPAAPAEKPAADKPKASTAQHHRDGALALLALLQREGRFLDFVTESPDAITDAELGAVTREIHRGCKKVIDQYLSLEPVVPGEEGKKATVPRGFDPAEIRLIGEAKGQPPFDGTLRHHGWRVVEARLPALAEGVDRTVVAPAEVELPTA